MLKVTIFAIFLSVSCYSRDSFLYSSQRSGKAIKKADILDPSKNDFYADMQGNIEMEPALLDLWKNPNKKNARIYLNKQKIATERGFKVAQLIYNEKEVLLKSKNDGFSLGKINYYDFEAHYFFRSDCPYCYRLNKGALKGLDRLGLSINAYQVDQKILKYELNVSKKLAFSSAKQKLVLKNGNAVPLIIIKNKKTNKEVAIKGYVELSQINSKIRTIL